MLVWIYEPLFQVSAQKPSVFAINFSQIKDGFVSLN